MGEEGLAEESCGCDGFVAQRCSRIPVLAGVKERVEMGYISDSVETRPRAVKRLDKGEG